MKDYSIGNDTDVSAIRVRAEPIISIGDLPRDNVYVRTASNSYGEIKAGVLVDVAVNLIPSPIIEAAQFFERTNPSLKFPYALIVEEK